MFYKTSCVYPRALVKGFKTHSKFCKTSYEMNIHFRFFFKYYDIS